MFSCLAPATAVTNSRESVPLAYSCEKQSVRIDIRFFLLRDRRVLKGYSDVLLT